MFYTCSQDELGGRNVACTHHEADELAKRLEEKEARWAEMDKRDAEKLKAKEEKKLEKIRKKKRKAFEAAAKQAEKDAAVLESYRKKFEMRKQKAASGSRRK